MQKSATNKEHLDVVSVHCISSTQIYHYLNVPQTSVTLSSGPLRDYLYSQSLTVANMRAAPLMISGGLTKPTATAAQSKCSTLPPTTQMQRPPLIV
jgi:hypothetical protein